VLVAVSSGAEIGKILGVIGVFTLVQFIDNNILMPNIVAGKVKVNALVSIVGVVVGGAIGGAAGMFLAIPTLAILKVVFDHSLNMRNWGILLGDDIPVQGLDLTGIKNYLRKISVYPASTAIPVSPPLVPPGNQQTAPGTNIILPDNNNNNGPS
jgi:hypothetical protein